jgi:hypothetical protein
MRPFRASLDSILRRGILSLTAFDLSHHRVLTRRRGRHEICNRFGCSVLDEPSRVCGGPGMPSGFGPDAASQLCREARHRRSAEPAGSRPVDPGRHVSARFRIEPKYRWGHLADHPDLPALLALEASTRGAGDASASGSKTRSTTYIHAGWIQFAPFAIWAERTSNRLFSTWSCARGPVPVVRAQGAPPYFRAFGTLLRLVWRMTPTSKSKGVRNHDRTSRPRDRRWMT